MEKTFETSFIPQQPLVRVEGTPRRNEPMNLALILALIVFFVTLMVAGGIYFYKLQVDKRILAKEQQLQSEEKNLNIDEINAYKHIDDKLTTVKTLLQNHTVFSTILLLLEKSTAANIGFTSLDYKKTPSGDYVVTLSAKAPSYSAAYFQGEAWRAVPIIKNVKISAPSADLSSGIVSFGVELLIDSSAVKYNKMAQTEDELSGASHAQAGAAPDASSTQPVITQ